MTIAKKISTLCFQLESSMSGNETFLRKVDVIKNEFNLGESSTKCIPDPQRQQLNRVLHSTRAFDSGLRLFLEKHGRLDVTLHSIGNYIKVLQNVRTGDRFRQLNGTDAANINTLITKVSQVKIHKRDLT
jgi:hypothetical protein